MGLIATLLAVAAVAAHAQETTLPTLHGFGERAFGRTDGNEYLVGTDSGSYRSGLLALSVGASPTDRLWISGQFALEQSREGSVVELEYAFAEWRFSDSLKLRAGRIKQPFGNYTEIFHVGTVRPFYTLPQGIYGPAGIVAEGFDGISIFGRRRMGAGWALQYDAYGGGILVESTGIEPAVPGAPQGEEEEELEAIDDTVGGRLVLETPVAGLQLGVSGYTGKEPTGEDEAIRQSAYGAHAEYLAGPWALRGEYVRHTEKAGPRIEAYYLEAARRLGVHWQLAARYDWSHTVDTRLVLPDPALGRHADAAFGLNYWFAPGMVLKLDYHRVEGNRFARAEPDELADQIEAGELETRTHLALLGVQFSF